MISFSVNKAISKKTFVLTNEKDNLTFVKVDGIYQLINSKDNKVIVSVMVNNFEIVVKSTDIKCLKPFIYSVANKKVSKDLNSISIISENKFEILSSNEKEIQIVTDFAHIKFSVQKNVLVLNSNKCLSLDSNQCVLQVMNF
ncbi:hypothetical protein AS033_00755 [Exiguobacterium indicum]|uniref:Uncharacterized protein n=1 Tax=Exiguobacterium indicum TaxID=296995 RepID=A0A0V8GI23_9BACL|nr:hypothetical protein [Exiguobacterium enclense]KSU49928.1 hypothetical protein AS033_00755 [Exiguobacterium enclense]SDB86490.1 hypothetical protein SAMN05216342_0154 [Exiguobacterium enclense]